MSARTVTKHAKLIIASLDGVFHDAQLVMRQSMIDLMHRFGVIADQNDAAVQRVLVDERGKLRADNLPAFLAGRDDPSGLQRLKERYGADIWREIATRDLSPLPGSGDFLRNTRRAPFVVLSDSGPEVTDAAMQRYMLIARPPVLTRDDLRGLRGTPHPDRLLAVAERYGVTPETCLVITASVSGATAGQEAGMHVIALRTLHPNWDRRSKVIVVDSLADLDVVSSGTDVTITVPLRGVERNSSISI